MVTADGQVLLENTGGTVLATLVLASGSYTPGTFAVVGGIADGFTLTTGGGGDTLLTTDVVNSVWNNTSGVWQTALDWSTGGVPGANDTAVIGVNPTGSATGTIDPSVLTTGTTAVVVGALIEANNNATLQITSATTVGIGGNNYGISQIAGEIEVTAGNTLTTTVLKQLSPGADLQIDAGAVLDLIGHSNLGFANNGTLSETTIVNGGTLIDGGIFYVGNAGTGTLVVEGGGTVEQTGINFYVGTVVVNGGTLDTNGSVVIGGTGGSGMLTVEGTDLFNTGTGGADINSNGTVVVSGAGTVEGAYVSVGSGGLLQAGSLTIDNAITQGGIGTLAIDTGGTVLVSSITLGAGGLLSLDGGVLDPITVNVTGASPIDGTGTLDANVSFASSAGILTYAGSGTLEITGTVSGPGTLDLGSGTVLLDTAPGSTPTVTFGPGVETLILAAPTVDASSSGPSIFTAIVDVGFGDLIEVGNGITIDSVWYTSIGGGGGGGGENVTLDVTQGGTDGFIILNDVVFTGGATGFNIVNGNELQAACYAAGTRIATPRGEVAVEELQVGDLVQTVLREATAPIIWIGRRQVHCAQHPKPRQVWPVCVAAGAFGPGRPHEELVLSPDHAVYVNEVLIPIQHLVNGSTIRQVPVDQITYHHIELPQHDVVLAQGLPAETYLDMRDGSNYANRPGPTRLYPDFSARMWEAFGCAPLIVTGPELAAAPQAA